jgi:ABC-2 type transport system ATP-binding protein
MTRSLAAAADRAPASAAVVASGLAKVYDRVVAVADLTMTVPRGEIFGFLGPNGAGKTTAVKLLLGLTFPTAGEAFVLGAPLGDRETRRRIGYLPELFRYQDWLTAREVLSLHCALAGVARERRSARIGDALATVGLATRAGDRVGTYSKGMQQRLGLAVALVASPDLVFLDEPTSALDPVGRREVRDLLHGLKRDGVTVFLNSHLLTEVEHVCDRVAVIDRGRIIAVGPPSSLSGDAFAVRIGFTETAKGYETVLQRFGRAETDGASVVLHDTAPSQVPDAIAALVEAGARITSVEPVRSSLEDRFLRLLRGSGDAAVRDR